MARGALRDLTGADERLELALALLACVFVQRHSGIVLEPSPTPAPSCENNRGIVLEPSPTPAPSCEKTVENRGG